jgi:hypothetical protein
VCVSVSLSVCVYVCLSLCIHTYIHIHKQGGLVLELNFDGESPYYRPQVRIEALSTLRTLRTLRHSAHLAHSGLKWLYAGPARPPQGRELINPKLALALATKCLLNPNLENRNRLGDEWFSLPNKTQLELDAQECRFVGLDLDSVRIYIHIYILHKYK